MRPLLCFSLALLLLPAEAQVLFQVQATPLKPTQFNFDAYNVPGFEARVLIKPIGVEFGRYSTRYNTKSNQGFPLYHNEFANLKIRCKVKEKDGEVTKYSYFTVGYETVNQSKEFAARSRDLAPPDYDTTDLALLYTDCRAVARHQSRMLSVGVERVKEVRREATGFLYYLTPWGIISVVSSSGKMLHFTKTLYAQVLVNPFRQGSMTVEKAFTSSNFGISVPVDQVVVEPLMVNRAGFKTGFKVCSLKPIGYSFALEAGMITAPFDIDGVYGNNFPDDNIFFQTQLGLSLGHSWKD